MSDDEQGYGSGLGIVAQSGRAIVPGQPGQGRHQPVGVGTSQFVAVDSANPFIGKQGGPSDSMLSLLQSADCGLGQATGVGPVNAVAAGGEEGGEPREMGGSGDRVRVARAGEFGTAGRPGQFGRLEPLDDGELGCHDRRGSGVMGPPRSGRAL